MKRYPNCVCSKCNKPIYRRPSSMQNGAVYCSQTCYGLAIRKPIPCPICGAEILASKNRITCSKTCSNIHRARLGPYKNPGRPKKDKAKDCRTMKERLIEARGPKCEKCGYDKVPVLNSHHIIQRKDGGSNNLSNLALLCRNCHGEVHCGLLIL